MTILRLGVSIAECEFLEKNSLSARRFRRSQGDRSFRHIRRQGLGGVALRARKHQRFLHRHTRSSGFREPEGEGGIFAVLLNEGRLARLLRNLSGRSVLSHVFIVIDADESFKVMAAEVVVTLGAHNPGLQMVQLYRDYRANFTINTGEAK
jgi:hypothetical protein